MSQLGRAPWGRQRGAAAVEFGLVAVLFLGILLGAVELGRIMWVWNAAAEATRLGARVAVVCDKNDTTVVALMRERLPYLANGNVTVAYLPDTCTAQTCTSVRVTLAGYTHRTLMLIPLNIPIPTFQTTLPKEYMDSTSNDACGP